MVGDDNTFIGPKRAAEILGCCESHVRKLGARGTLPCYRLPGSMRRRYMLADVERLAREAAVPDGPAGRSPVAA